MWDLVPTFPHETLLAFLAAGLLLNLTPGSDVMFATASGLRGGPRVGAAAGLGVGLGGIWHVGLATLGLSALIAAWPSALLALKWLGAAYLLWLAWASWTAPPAPTGQGGLTARAALWRGFITNALNPKVALFILAFLPQFTDPGRGPVWVQVLTLGALFTLTGTCVTAAYGALAGVLRASIAHRMSLLNRIAGAMLAILALRMVRG
jgi:threonine/homoserine/homoserine lactone efflux protein